MQNNPHTAPSAPAPDHAAWPGGLTPTQADVARLIAIGASRTEIAEALEISEKTVDTHRRHALVKVGARNSVHLTRIALRLGLVSLDESQDATGAADE